MRPPLSLNCETRDDVLPNTTRRGLDGTDDVAHLLEDARGKLPCQLRSQSVDTFCIARSWSMIARFARMMRPCRPSIASRSAIRASIVSSLGDSLASARSKARALPIGWNVLCTEKDPFGLQTRETHLVGWGFAIVRWQGGPQAYPLRIKKVDLGTGHRGFLIGRLALLL